VGAVFLLDFSELLHDEFWDVNFKYPQSPSVKFLNSPLSIRRFVMCAIRKKEVKSLGNVNRDHTYRRHSHT
jgi:hypothetical protein